MTWPRDDLLLNEVLNYEGRWDWAAFGFDLPSSVKDILQSLNICKIRSLSITKRLSSSRSRSKDVRLIGIGKRGSCVVVEVAQLTKTGFQILHLSFERPKGSFSSEFRFKTLF